MAKIIGQGANQGKKEKTLLNPAGFFKSIFLKTIL
jgi:hypothetical protein